MKASYPSLSLENRQYEVAQIFAKIAMRILKKKKEALATKTKPGK